MKYSQVSWLVWLMGFWIQNRYWKSCSKFVSKFPYSSWRKLAILKKVVLTEPHFQNIPACTKNKTKDMLFMHHSCVCPNCSAVRKVHNLTLHSFSCAVDTKHLYCFEYWALAFLRIYYTRNTCMQQPLAFISKHCVNMKYFGLCQQWTQAHFARVMLTMATRSMFFLFFGKKGIK